jgi:hypothetical protein
MNDAYIETLFTYLSEHGYRYEVSSSEEMLKIAYIEVLGKDKPDLEVSISFGSPEEMEQVAQLMLRAAQVAREFAKLK